MTIKCMFGSHTWDYCKCTKCGKFRNEKHDWNSNRYSNDCMCLKCDKTGKKIETQGSVDLMNVVSILSKHSLKWQYDKKDKNTVIVITEYSLDAVFNDIDKIRNTGVCLVGKE